MENRRRGRLCSTEGIVALLCALACLVPGCTRARTGGDETLRGTVAPLHDLVGVWSITRMDVKIVPRGPESALELDIHSRLGGPSHFTIHSDGTITGGGTAEYAFNVSGVLSPSALSTLGCILPVDARASGNGQRTFKVTGHADLQQQTVSLNAFEPLGEPLTLTVRQGPTVRKELEIPAWPPTTNLIEIPVEVERGTLVLRAQGTLGGGSLAIDVSFEAVMGADATRSERRGGGGP